MLSRENLHNYQRAAVEHIIKHKYCGLFLDLGLGKTVSTLTAIEDLMFDWLEINSVLVIAPKRVVESVWEEEASKWKHLKHLRFSKIIGRAEKRKEALRKSADVYVISRDNIDWLCDLYDVHHGNKLPFDMVVIDELSSFKSHSTMRFRAMKKVRPHLKRLVGLTGTPAPNSLIDLWPQLYLIDLGERLGKTISAYRREYFKAGKTRGHIVFSYLPLELSEKKIQDKIRDICISMSSSDYLELPECKSNYIKIPMPNDLRKKYKSFEREKVIELSQSISNSGNGSIISVTNAAALSNKLLQFAQGALYDDEKNVTEVHNLKLDALKEIIENANGQPVLVAWTYVFDKDRIMRSLKAYKPRELKTNRDIDDWNSGKIQVMLAHPASAGHGLNLQSGGCIIVWYGLTWSLELYQQFNARLYRQGQKKCVVINHLILDGTHDEDVIKALSKKDKTQNSLLESIKAKLKSYEGLFVNKS